MSGVAGPIDLERECLMVEEGAVGSRRGARWTKAVALVPLAAFAAILGTVALTQNPAPTTLVKADVGARTSLEGDVGMMELLLKALSAGSDVTKDSEELKEHTTGLLKILMDPAAQEKKEIFLEHLRRYNETIEEHMRHHGAELIPDNKLTDGNPCADTEEAHAGLCYEPCKDLTKGEYPIRTTAFSCCKSQPCSFFNSKFTNPFKACSGMDVSKGTFGGECPHLPGDCLENEEFNLGVCYKQCAILTNLTHPYRFNGNSCCRYKSHLACGDPANLKTDPSYNVGGGVGDNEWSARAGRSHLPFADIAEKKRGK